MATVITNLLSAIPVFGQDLVELIWGGFNIEGPYYSYIILKILLDAGISLYIFLFLNIFEIIYFIIQLYINYNFFIIIIIWNKYSKVKNMITTPVWLRKKGRGQSAVVLIVTFILEFTQRLFLNINKMNKINTIFKNFYTTLSSISSANQRLLKKESLLQGKKESNSKYKKNVKGLSYGYLVGLIEGDGWISISKKGKNLSYEIGLEMNIKDIQLLYKIKHSLGVGKILIRVRKGINNNKIHLARYNVRNKQHLREIFIPILDKYPMLTNKQYDYLRFREALINNILLFDGLTTQKYTRPKEPINSVDNILSKSYFSAWLIGFIEAEACFSIYQSKINDQRSLHSKKQNSYVGSFDISQTNSFEIIQSIKQYLNISGNIYQDKTNCYKLKTTSIRNIDNVIQFLKNNPIRLLGNKRLQFILFIKKLRKIPRYSNFIKIPNNY